MCAPAKIVDYYESFTIVCFSAYRCKIIFNCVTLDPKSFFRAKGTFHQNVIIFNLNVYKRMKIRGKVCLIISIVIHIIILMIVIVSIGSGNGSHCGSSRNSISSSDKKYPRCYSIVSLLGV